MTGVATGRVRFVVAWEYPVWPVIPLAAAIAGALAVFALRFPALAPVYLPDNWFWWWLILLAAISIIAIGPRHRRLLAVFLFDWVMALALRLYLNATFARETVLLRAIVAAEEKLRAQLESVGVNLGTSAAASCRDLILRQAPGRSSSRVRAHLAEHRAALERSLAGMSTCLAMRLDVYAAFERAKAAVIRQGGPTLLAEIDRVLHGLESEMLKGLFRGGDWDEIRETFKLMIADLDGIRAAAERGDAGPRPASEPEPESPDLPTTPEEAYAVLNLRPGSSRDVMKKTVEALRLNWHPDLVSDPAERALCTARIQRINAAWDIIQRSRAAGPDAAG